MSQQKQLISKVKKSAHPNVSAEASHVKSKKNQLTLMSQQKHLMLKEKKIGSP